MPVLKLLIADGHETVRHGLEPLLSQHRERAVTQMSESTADADPLS
jgi:DNA-binding NarL/FixJ family response regulator